MAEIKDEERARQFMPFAALTGFYDIIREYEEKSLYRNTQADEASYDKATDNKECIDRR